MSACTGFGLMPYLAKLNKYQIWTPNEFCLMTYKIKSNKHQIRESITFCLMPYENLKSNLRSYSICSTMLNLFINEIAKKDTTEKSK